MKKVITSVLLIILLALKVTYADVHPTDGTLPTYRLILKNDTQITSKIYRFEIWISSVSSTVPLDLRQWQAGIAYNTAMLNGGTITGALDYTGSILLAFNDMYPNGFNTATSGVLKISAKLGAVTSHIPISSTGVESKLVTVTITNSVDFAQVKPNLTWNFSNSTYPSKVFAWLSASIPNAQVTIPNNSPGTVIQSWHTTDQLNNPFFNKVPTVYSVSGTGSYCSTGTGGTVTLNNSETGVAYELFKNNTTTGMINIGTGSAVTWTNNTFGTYKVQARRTGTNLINQMADSAVLSEIIGIPGAAGTITGNTTICQGNPGESYSVPVITNAETYTWEYSGTGVTINGNTNTTQLNFSSSATSGNLTVKGQNACGFGTVSLPLAIVLSNLPDAAGVITGVSTVSPGQTAVAYTVPVINGATSYTWSYSGIGATIIGNTNAVTIDFGANATPGFLTVKGTNACGNGTVSADFAINVNSVPGAAGNIIGSSSICPGQNNVMFHVPEILGADTYLWEYSGTGVTIDSTLGDTAYINFSMAATSGNLTVKGHNSFGYGAVSPNFAITMNSFPVAAGVISGSDTVCKNTNNITYTVPVIQYATNYIWTLPTGATGTSTTNTISVNFGSTAVNGNIIVKGTNICGDGTASSKPIVINTVPVNAGTITGASPVCAGTNNLTYTVPAISGATSYIWTLPSGVTGTSTTNSINVNVSTTSSGGQITVKGSNACGNGTASAMSLTVNPLPSAAGTITGLATVCQGQSGVSYTVPSITNATSYVWEKPNGATGTSTTTTIIIGYSNTASSGNITVKGSNTCGTGTASTLAVTVNPLPDTAKIVTGLSTVCKGITGVVYKVVPVANATSYEWTLPTGITGTSTVDSIVVDITSTAVSGNIVVKGVNSCGYGVSKSYAVTVNDIPPQPTTISGNSTVCQGQTSVTYSITALTGATSYIWTIPTGFTGTSTTNSITVNVANNASSGNITVKGTNSCGDGLPGSLAVTVNSIPDTAGTITGTLTVCQGQSNVTYTVPTINNATSYLWTPPAGANGSSTTNSITLNFQSYAVSGNLKVKGQNACGFGQESIIAITVNQLPSTAGTISGSAVVCKGTNGVVYKIPAISNANSYVWTYPTGFTVSGSSTLDSIVLNVGSTAVSGSITVKGSNSCGTGTASTKTVTVNSIPNTPGAITGLDTVCSGSQNISYSISSVSGATSYIWTLPTGATGSSTTNNILVNFGTSATSGNIVVKASNLCGTSDSSYKHITISTLPGAAGTITGNANVCQGATAVTYSIPAIAGVTSYVWTLPTGFSGTSSTNTISVNIGNNAVSGNISVYGTNSCGNGTAANLAVTVSSLPGAAGTITCTSGNCDTINIPNVTRTFTVPAITGATSYVWTYSGNNVTINGTTNTVTLTFATNATSGVLTVMGHNTCGDGPVSQGYPIYSTLGVNETDGSDLSYSIYPNPTKGIITVDINGISNKLELQITNIQGEIIRTQKIDNDKLKFKTDIDLTNYSKGIYFVKIINNNFVKVEKVVLQ